MKTCKFYKFFSIAKNSIALRSLALFFLLLFSSVVIPSQLLADVWNDTFRSCMQNCSPPCCDERCSYAACTAKVQSGNMQGQSMKDPGAWGTAMAVCAPHEQRIRQCGQEYADRHQATSDRVDNQSIPNWRTTDNGNFIDSLYRSILDRTPDGAGYNHWLSLLRSGKSRESVISWFLNSPEYKTRNKNNHEYVRDVYQALYGREPFQHELDQAVRNLTSGVSRQQILNAAMAGSSNNEDSDLLLNRDILVKSSWKFGRGDGSIISSNYRLLNSGSMSGHYHPNESSWKFDGKVLTFYHSSGKPSTRFTSFRKDNNNKWILSGQFLLHPNITHVLQQN